MNLMYFYRSAVKDISTVLSWNMQNWNYKSRLVTIKWLYKICILATKFIISVAQQRMFHESSKIKITSDVLCNINLLRQHRARRSVIIYEFQSSPFVPTHQREKMIHGNTATTTATITEHSVIPRAEREREMICQTLAIC